MKQVCEKDFQERVLVCVPDGAAQWFSDYSRTRLSLSEVCGTSYAVAAGRAGAGALSWEGRGTRPRGGGPRAGTRQDSGQGLSAEGMAPAAPARRQRQESTTGGCWEGQWLP